MSNEPFMVDTPSATASKSDWRTYLVKHRLALGGTERGSAERRIADQLSARAVLEDWARVLVFLPWKGEPDLMMVWRAWSRRGLELGLPVVEAHASPLRLVGWQPGKALLKDLMGLPIPQESEEKDFDTWVLPCVGVDREGHRIGAGKGFYDRTIEALLARGHPRPRIVGVCFEAARLNVVLGEAHDLQLDAVLTEAGWFDFQAAEGKA